MSASDGLRRSRAARMGEVALWSAAGLVVFAAHAYAVALMLREPEAVLADDSPPAAIMIELAAEPEAASRKSNRSHPMWWNPRRFSLRPSSPCRSRSWSFRPSRRSFRRLRCRSPL